MSERRGLSVEDVSGVWAIVPTPAVDSASSWREQETVDISESTRVAEELIKAGVDAIVSLGTLGECATLTRKEKRTFMGAMVETIGGRVPYLGGTTSLSTRDSVEATREARDLGVDGTILGVPMWCAPDVSTAVQFYRDVAEACPDLAICVYANNEAFKFSFPRRFWELVSEIPQVIAAKYRGVENIVADIEGTKRRIRFLPRDADYCTAARLDPEFCTAFWTSGAVCGPAPVIRLRDAVAEARRSGEWETAEQLAASIGRTYASLFPKGSFKEFSTYNIGLEKERASAAGWMKPGPCRPPYHLVPEEYLKGARQSGQEWAKLHQQYSSAN